MMIAFAFKSHCMWHSQGASSGSESVAALLETAHEHLNTVETSLKAATRVIAAAQDKLISLPFSLEDLEMRETRWKQVSVRYTLTFLSCMRAIVQVAVRVRASFLDVCIANHLLQGLFSSAQDVL